MLGNRCALYPLQELVPSVQLHPCSSSSPPSCIQGTSIHRSIALRALLTDSNTLITVCALDVITTASSWPLRFAKNIKTSQSCTAYRLRTPPHKTSSNNQFLSSFNPSLISLSYPFCAHELTVNHGGRSRSPRTLTYTTSILTTSPDLQHPQVIDNGSGMCKAGCKYLL